MDFICIYCALVWHGSSYGIVRAADGWVCKNHQMWLSELENTTGHLTSTFWTIVVLLVTTKTIRPVTSNAKICLLCSPLCYFSVLLCVALKDMNFDCVVHWLGQLLQPRAVMPLSSETIVSGEVSVERDGSWCGKWSALNCSDRHRRSHWANAICSKWWPYG